jgi:hypothetical protein
MSLCSWAIVQSAPHAVLRWKPLFMILAGKALQSSLLGARTVWVQISGATWLSGERNNLEKTN